MHDDDYDEDDETTRALPGRRFSLIDVAIIALDGTSTFLSEFMELLCCHANYRINQREAADERKRFEDSVRADLERIPEATDV